MPVTKKISAPGPRSRRNFCAREQRGLDWDNLAEEIDPVGRRELESRLRLILHHLLKWQAQPGLRGRSWQSTLREQRRQAEKLLKESPSLRPQLPDLIHEAYPEALADALDETGLRAQTFPPTVPSRSSSSWTRPTCQTTPEASPRQITLSLPRVLPRPSAADEREIVTERPPNRPGVRRSPR